MKNLFITSTRIGDAVLSSAILSKLIEIDGDAKWIIACGESAAPLFEGVPNLEKIVIVKKKPYGLHWLYLWLAVVGYRFNRVVDLRRSALSYFIWCNKRQVIGKADPNLHRIDDMAKQFALTPAPAPKLWLLSSHHAAAKRMVPEIGFTPVLAVSPAANWGGKIWPIENFAQVIEHLVTADGVLNSATVVLFGAKGERDYVEQLKSLLPKVKILNLAGEIDLLACAAVFAQSSLFIGNDSGLMHIAAAAGAPTLGLFGPSREQEYGPRGLYNGQTLAVRTEKTYEELVFDSTFDYTSQQSLMATLSVDTVLSAANELLNRTQVKGAA